MPANGYTESSWEIIQFGHDPDDYLVGEIMWRRSALGDGRLGEESSRAVGAAIAIETSEDAESQYVPKDSGAGSLSRRNRTTGG
jgi:hypothetical protein